MNEIDKVQMQEFIIHAKRAVAADSVVLFTATHTDSETNRDMSQTAMQAHMDASDGLAACYLALAVAEWCDRTLNELTEGECRVKVFGGPHYMEKQG